MDHYSSKQWADFVLGKDPVNAGAIKLHLRTCPLCSESYQFWLRVAAVVDLGTRDQVPTSVLSHLHRAFRIWAKPNRLNLVFPRLSFDSLWEPYPVGVRSMAPSERTLVFQTDDLELRLRIEKRFNPERFWLDGQLAGKEDTGVVFEHLRTRIACDNLSFAESFTNKFGEFQFEFAQSAEIVAV